MKIKILDNLNSFNDRIKYCDKNFIFLGTGTHRKVYKLDENSVIKVCFNEGGINQCKFEQQLPESPILIKTLYYSNNYNYIIQEKAEPFSENKFKDITKLNFNEYRKALRFLNKLKIYNSCEKFIVLKNNSKPLNNMIYAFRYDKLLREFKDNLFFKDVLNLSKQYGNWLYGLSKKSSIGIVTREGEEKIVFIDYGLSKNNSTTPYTIKI